MLDKIGPKTKPCGTPLIMSDHSDLAIQKNMHLLLLFGTHASKYILTNWQRRSARWVCSTYSSITAMIESLNWVTLREHRKDYHDIICKASVVNIPQHFLRTTRHTCHPHPLHFVHPSANTTVYKDNHFPKTIIDWSTMSILAIEMTD